MGSTLQVRLPSPVTGEHVRWLCTALQDQLGTGSVTAVVCHADPAVGELATVDAVARLALVARRAGVPFRLDSPDDELSSLLGLTGLRTVLAGSDEP